MSAKYNSSLYNTTEYNQADSVTFLLDLDDTATLTDLLSFDSSLIFTETTTLTDSLNLNGLLILFITEMISSADGELNDPEKVLSEFIFLAPDIFARISEKGLVDTVHLFDWLSVRRPTDGDWFN